MAKRSSSAANKPRHPSRSPAAGKQSSTARKTIPPKRNPKSSTGLIIGYALVTFVVALGAIGFLFYRLAVHQPQVAEVKAPVSDGWGPGREEGGDDQEPAAGIDDPSEQEIIEPSVESKLADGMEEPIQQNDQADAEAEAPQPADDINVGVSNALATPTETTAPPVSETPLKEPPGSEPAPAAEPAMEPKGDAPANLPENETEDPTSGPLKPEQMDRFEAMLGEPVRFEGVPFSTNASGSGKTLYLRFSQDWDDTIMVFMLVRDVGEDLTLEELEKFVGKTVRIDGVVERQFGTNRLGVRLKAKDQIEVIE